MTNWLTDIQLAVFFSGLAKKIPPVFAVLSALSERASLNLHEWRIRPKKNQSSLDEQQDFDAVHEMIGRSVNRWFHDSKGVRVTGLVVFVRVFYYVGQIGWIRRELLLRKLFKFWWWKCQSTYHQSTHIRANLLLYVYFCRKDLIIVLHRMIGLIFPLPLENVF